MVNNNKPKNKKIEDLEEGEYLMVDKRAQCLSIECYI